MDNSQNPGSEFFDIVLQELPGEKIIPDEVGPPVQEKKRPGRPPGTGKHQQAAANQGNPGKSANGSASTSQGDLFSKMKSEVKENASRTGQANPGAGNPVSPGAAPAFNMSPAMAQDLAALLDGYMLLLMMDALFPTVIKFIFRKKLSNISENELTLNETQKKSLEPMANEFAKYLSQFINPVMAFALVTGVMYWNNAKDAIEKKEKANA